MQQRNKWRGEATMRIGKAKLEKQSPACAGLL
jgi:hypothetical protein